jgi:DNA-binding transcriptional MocR family regulator
MPRFRETILMDDYVLDVLMRDIVGHDRQPAAYLVYIYLFGLAVRQKWKPVAASLRTLAEATGLSKSAVQTALELLRRRQLIETTRRSLDGDPGTSRSATLEKIDFAGARHNTAAPAGRKIGLFWPGAFPLPRQHRLRSSSAGQPFPLREPRAEAVNPTVTGLYYLAFFLPPTHWSVGSAASLKMARHEQLALHAGLTGRLRALLRPLQNSWPVII